jgi:hypothetical protein
METESGRDLSDFFRHWTERTGAPSLALTDVETEPTPDGHVLRGRVEQTQDEDPFPLQVPLAVHLEGGGLVERVLPLTGRGADFELELPAAPLRVDADPRFDLFRALVPGESPPTLSALFGAEDGLIILPEDAPAALTEPYRRLADAWKKGSPGWEIARDADLKALPDDRPVWLLGWSNRFLGELAAEQTRFQLDTGRRVLGLPQGEQAGSADSLALVDRRGGQPVGWVASADPAALPGLARKLPHYGKYSYLAFDGKAPTNRLKGRWPVQDSDLMTWLDARRPQLPGLPPHSPLTAVID